MTKYSQREGLMFDVSVVITASGMPAERVANCTSILSVSYVKAKISASICPQSAVGYCSDSQPDIL